MERAAVVVHKGLVGGCGGHVNEACVGIHLDGDADEVPEERLGELPQVAGWLELWISLVVEGVVDPLV
jgi:hypothetical protein